MAMRPKSTHRDLPPRMLRRERTLKSGKVWESFYYNGRNAEGQRVEIPLGSDLNEAKRKWAELEVLRISGAYQRVILFSFPQASEICGFQVSELPSSGKVVAETIFTPTRLQLRVV